MAYTCVENVLYGVWDWKMPYKSDWEEESERMKVAYIGECDYLTTNALQRLRKEDYDVYVLSSDDIERKDSRWKGYHHYRLTGEKEEARRIFQAVNPDIVIYEGMGYLKEAWELEQRENFSYLSLILETCTNLGTGMFVFLSSVEVYGSYNFEGSQRDTEKECGTEEEAEREKKAEGGAEKESRRNGKGTIEGDTVRESLIVTEEVTLRPQTLKGRWILQEENIVQAYCGQKGMHTAILRLGPVFANEMDSEGRDIWGNLCQAIMRTPYRLEQKEEMLQPIHALDVADAVVRVIEREESSIYNVCGSKIVRKSDIVKLLMEKWMLDADERIHMDLDHEFPMNVEGTEHIQNYFCIGNGKIKSVLEWTDLWSLEDTLQNHAIFQELNENRRTKKAKQQEKKHKIDKNNEIEKGHEKKCGIEKGCEIEKRYGKGKRPERKKKREKAKAKVEDTKNGRSKKKVRIKESSKKIGLQNRLRRTIENLVLFAFFACLFLVTKDHSLFSKVDWLLIYVVLIALGYGVKQGALAVVLSSMVYLMVQGNSLWEMTNFTSYGESVLMMVEFIFFGIVVGYAADMLKERHRNDRLELERMSNSYENLKEINDQNVLLKNEYEKRVLDAKTSLPKLYSIVQRINVLDSNRIFMEVLTVIKELINTDTVAVYRVSANSSYLRLINSLNNESAMEGNSWNLKRYPKIERAIRNDQIYEGNVFAQEPAIVLPISSRKGCEAAIVIKELPMEACSRYSVNLLRTLLTLISDSLEKALRYDSALRKNRYWKNTNILNPAEFQKAIRLEAEKKNRQVADSCLLKMCGADDIAETYQRAEKMFREIDIWGMDERENLYVLLENTTQENAEYVRERLQKIGIKAEKVTNLGNG